MAATSALRLVTAHSIVPTSRLPALLGVDPWEAATAEKRRVAEVRCAVVAPLQELVKRGVTVTRAAEVFVANAKAGRLPPDMQHLLQLLGKEEGLSVPTLKRWISAYGKSGRVGLLPAHTGRVRQDYGWEAEAVAIYNTPSVPGYANVACRLRELGHASATDTRVEAFLKSLPATLGKYSPDRVGHHLHKLTRRSYTRRHLDDVLVGEIYTGDGHTIDCYVAHPNTGGPFRPELTAWLDVKSRFPVGWYLSESESAHSTLFAISTALTTHDHVPAWIYIDRGAGYRAKLMSDENTGWYDKWGITTIGALPRNPHGKGWIERWFRTLRDNHDKMFWGGEVYCGHDMAPEINERLSAQIAAGKRRLPSLVEYVQSLTHYINHYCTEPMEVLGGRCPADVWCELKKVPVVLDSDATLRPSAKAKVRRQAVRLHNRFYEHEALALYDGAEVEVEYDLHRDKQVWIKDAKGRLICIAELVRTVGVIPMSRLEEARDKREKAQLQRIERKAQEVRARRQDAITADAQVRAIELLTPTPLALPAQRAPEPLEALPQLDSPIATQKAQPPAAAPGGDITEIDFLDWRPNHD